MLEQGDDVSGLVLVAILFGVFILARAITYFLGPHEEQKAKPQDCKPHDWSIHPVTNKLTCCRCDFVAGTHNTDLGDY